MTDFVPTFPSVVDSTMRGDFVSCPQKFFQGYILKRSLKGSSIHLTAGGAYAKGLEIVRKLVWGPQKLSVDNALAVATPHVWAEFGDEYVPEGYEHKGPINVVRALIAYFDHYNPATDLIQPYMKANGEPAVEFTFSFPTQVKHPITGDPILYAGRFDMIGIYNGTAWTVDDKTASSLGPSWDKSWGLRGQLTGYTFAAQQYGIPVQGAIIRGISLLKPTKDHPFGSAFGFSEPIEYRSPFQIERWWVQLHRDIARMVDCWNDKGDNNEFPYGYWDYDLHEACNAYGGCPFRTLCNVSNPDAWASTDYEFRDWNPLHVNPVK